MNNRKNILAATLFVQILIILFQAVSLAEELTPRAINGNIDLSYEQVQQLPLQGEWEFYWKQRLEPKDFKSSNTLLPDYIEVPSSWKGKSIGAETLGSTGFATYRLQLYIDPAETGQEKVLALGNVGSAYEIWIDGVKRGGAGSVGIVASEEEASLQINHYHFIPTNEVIEIVIQVSNFSYRKGGIYTPITYQSPSDVLQSTLKTEIDSFLIIGGLLFMGVYNLIIFTVTIKFQRDLLMIGLASVFMAIRSFLINDYLSTLLLSDLPLSMIKRMEYIVEMVSFLFVILSMRFLYPKDIHPLMVKVTYVYVLLCGVYNLFAPTLVFTQTMIYQFLIMVIITAYFLFYVGLLAFIRKREGAIFTIVGLIVLILGILNDVLSSALIIPSLFELEFSFLLFIMLQGVIVSYRYLALSKRNQSLNDRLLEMNEQLEGTVEQRTLQLMEKNKELAQANLKLEALSSTDGLTGLPNRRQLNSVLEDEWSKAAEKGNSLAIMLIDIDYYKNFNDTYGHLSGDDGLRLVARVLMCQVKNSDIFAARYGGEEFMVLISEATHEKAYQTADSIRQSVQDLREPHQTSPFGFLTVSIGVAIGGPHNFTRPEMLIERADKALYQAKKDGRNKVVA
ncbi:diguanylate cyclase [Ammoniphilus sp. CFH 90114]|uniref:diguanylate cyclase domain-containing protein n=1 Tax=Ammoniphilus sp. CFH 90114 TaxID=2493665 RepID=UPI00100E7462|nr:diguanylate cyclase [Ammoniphilus sp. CFH 90114]RXT07176.1 diguanylate cyclase [Ammoniphilus sp. CFH 90114]